MSLSHQLTSTPLSHEFADAVLTGLGQQSKKIPSRFLYDARGSELFEEITELEEYYPTRTEIGLLERHARDIAELAGAQSALIEFGSGSSKKTKILIEALGDLTAYIPIDISESALEEAKEHLKRKFPHLVVLPIHADFNHPVHLPHKFERVYRLGFFPGSTIGNFEHGNAINFLKRIRTILGTNSGLVIGADLQKDLDILIPAYDDAAGVTAEFNLNLLNRINRELDGNFNIDSFAHKIVYNSKLERIEMHLESLKRQKIQILNETISFEKGERIHTENSHKYTLESFGDLVNEAGWSICHTWTDKEDLFSVHYLEPSQS